MTCSCFLTKRLSGRVTSVTDESNLFGLFGQCLILRDQGSKAVEVTSLVDHVKITTGKGISTEWGLSLHVKCNDLSILFDMGPSGHFVGNAAALGIDITSVELAVLSHGHYDHGGGLRTFLTVNSKAVVYMGKGADADLNAKLLGLKRYVGLEKEIFRLYGD